MDPLNLLKELYGEDPVRRILSSGFDSVEKIAAATPESLSFFAGIQEALARQIIGSAEEGVGKPAGKAEALEPPAAVAPPTQPREMPRPSPPAPRRAEAARSRSIRAEPLDDHPILDAGGVLRSLAREPHLKALLDDESFLEEVGLSDAEAGFLQGISPWSSPSQKERHSPAPPLTKPFPGPETTKKADIEFAPVSDWSPEKDPDPVPRLVRAPELSEGPLRDETGPGAVSPEPPAVLAPAVSDLSCDETGPGAVSPEPAAVLSPAVSDLSCDEKRDPGKAPPGASFWRFGR